MLDTGHCQDVSVLTENEHTEKLLDADRAFLNIDLSQEYVNGT